MTEVSLPKDIRLSGQSSFLPNESLQGPLFSTNQKPDTVHQQWGRSLRPHLPAARKEVGKSEEDLSEEEDPGASV